MSEINRVSKDTAAFFGVTPVAPLRECDMMRIIRRLIPMLEIGVAFYPAGDSKIRTTYYVVYSSMILKPFGLIIHSGCINICTATDFDKISYSIEIEMEDEDINTMTIAIVAALLNKREYTSFSILKY